MAADAGLGVVRRPLVRVLAVDELVHALEREQELRRERLDVREPRRDRRLVGRRVGEGLGREPTAGVQLDAAVSKLVEDLAVPFGLAEGHDVDEVLGGRAEERRPADVDHLDGVLLADVGARRHALERVEVHADEVERAEPCSRSSSRSTSRPRGRGCRWNTRVEVFTLPPGVRDVGELLDGDDVDRRAPTM